MAISQNDRITVINGEYNEYEEDDEEEVADEEEDDFTFYEPEEISFTRFNITLCELYNASCYGTPSFESLHAHYMVLFRFKQYDTYLLNKLIERCADEFIRHVNYKHPSIRNFQCINRIMTPEIAECIYLSTGECICIKKTIWIRLVQRAWKKIFKLRQEIIMRRHQPRHLFYRGITGSWSIECNRLPSIRGILAPLKHSYI